ncbi:hypothetical protein H310_04964 [Aphanomyces invadans]|uniref:DDE Tnp4 domain-containing protein n=1 Tax=Aphanomyces invadans TaxID=157072 RepID=A0A024UAU7_9STRA|nr:hypothetical protein H310_04964 [Aphanomyces invadans]ETW03536.1 hypothetical protein H310_04964 [Aphanomyces invadans]|eukprot:XP_008867765.1 hypothetical protein H310_04964 [Aphanomyces invadans]
MAMLEKTPHELALPDHGELSTQFRNHWACLADMGYIGISHTIRGITPKRRPVSGILDASDLGQKSYDSIQRTTFALTNFHVSLMPLRYEDATFYGQVLAREDTG